MDQYGPNHLEAGMRYHIPSPFTRWLVERFGRKVVTVEANMKVTKARLFGKWYLLRLEDAKCGKSSE